MCIRDRDRRLQVAQVESGGPGGRDDPIRGNRRTHPRKAGNVVGAIPHRVVGHVYDLVAGFGASDEHGGDAGNRLGAAIDDTIEVDEKKHGQDATGAAKLAPDRAGRSAATGRLRPELAPAGAGRPAAAGRRCSELAPDRAGRSAATGLLRAIPVRAVRIRLAGSESPCLTIAAYSKASSVWSSTAPTSSTPSAGPR